MRLITHDNFGGAFDSVGINRFSGGPGLSHEKKKKKKKAALDFVMKHLKILKS